MKDPIHKLNELCYHLQLLIYGREAQDSIEINSIISNVEPNVLAIALAVYAIRKYNIAIDNL